MTNKKKHERRISIRSIRRNPPDIAKLGKAFISLAIAQAEAEAQAESEKEGRKEGRKDEDTTPEGDA